MIFLETPRSPSRRLSSSGRLSATPETGNVFGLTQALDLPEKVGPASPVSPIAQHEELDSIELETLRERQIEFALKRVRHHPGSSYAANAAAQTLLTIGENEKAIDFFHKALELDPNNHVVKLNLARGLALIGQWGRAEELYQDLLNCSGTIRYHALKSLAQLLIVTNRFAEAETLLTTVAEDNGKDAGAYNERGVARLAQHKVGEAIRDFRAAIRLDVRFAAAYNNLGISFLRSGSLNRALSAFRTALKLNPGYGNAALNFATAAERAGRAEEAIRALEDYRTFRRKDGRVIEALARLYIAIEQPAKGLRLLDELSREGEFGVSPNETARLINNMGVAYTLLGRIDNAMECFRRSIASGASDCTPYCNFAEALLARGRGEEANAVLTEALARYREDARAQQLLASYYMRRDVPEAAVACLRRSLELNPRDWLSYAWLGSILSDAFGQHDEGVQILREGIRVAPEAAVLRNNLAYVLLMKGAVGEARQVLESVQRPTARDLIFLTATRGLLALREGRIQEGQRLYNEAARLTSDKETRNLVLQKKAVEVARVYVQQGDFRRAKELLAEAHRLAPASHKLFLKQASGLLRALGTGEATPVS